MELELRFFANFREIVGQKEITGRYDGVSTIGDLIEALSDEYPDMELLEGDGSLREFITVMRNGRDVAHIEGLQTALDDGDTVSVFPPVAGG